MNNITIKEIQSAKQVLTIEVENALSEFYKSVGGACLIEIGITHRIQESPMDTKKIVRVDVDLNLKV